MSEAERLGGAELGPAPPQLVSFIGANVVRAHERFPCGGRRSGH